MWRVGRRTALGMLGGLLIVAAFLPPVQWAWQSNVLARQAIRAVADPTVPVPAPDAARPRTIAWAAAAHLARGNVPAAETVLGSATASPDPLVQLAQAQVADRRGDAADAAARWGAAGAWAAAYRASEREMDAQHWGAALTYLAAAAPGMPELVVFPQAKARAALDGPAGGVTVLEAALTQWPASTRRQEWLTRDGELLLDLRRWPVAEAAFRDALSLRDSGYAALAEIGLGRALFFGGGAPDEARAYVQRGIALNPRSRTGYVAMGDLAAAEGDRAAARRWYGEALARDPGNADIRARLAALDAAPAPPGG